MNRPARAAAAGLSALAAVAGRDLLQREHTLLRNFPVIGHARYLLESIGPELRQYLVAGNNEERPFTRDQRRWVYASAKKENNYFGFGTDNDLEYTAGYPIIKHRTFGRAVPPSSPAGRPRRHAALRQGARAARGRRQAFRPNSVVNISAMSFGSLSGTAIEALNQGRGAGRLPAQHRRGRDLPHHRHGGDLVFQIGTAYFGCRDDEGGFDLAAAQGPGRGAPVRAWRSSSARARSRASAACCRPRRCRRRSPRPGACARGRLHQPVPARRVLRHRQPARLGRAAGRRDRAAGRHQVRRRRHGSSGTSSPT